jgi:hypothetical protein
LAFIRELALKQKGVNSNLHSFAVSSGRAAKDGDTQPKTRRNGAKKPPTALTSSGRKKQAVST